MPKHYQYTIGDVPENIKTKHAFRILRGKATTNYGVADAIYKHLKLSLDSMDTFTREFTMSHLKDYEARSKI